MSKAAALFVGAHSKFVSLLEAYKEKLLGEEAPEPAAEAPEPAEAEASDETAPEAEASNEEE